LAPGGPEPPYRRWPGATPGTAWGDRDGARVRARPRARGRRHALRAAVRARRVAALHRAPAPPGREDALRDRGGEPGAEGAN